MLIPCQINLIVQTARIDNFYAVYIHRDAADTIQFIGVSPLLDLYRFEDARRNSLWSSIFELPNAVIDMQVVGITDNQREAYREQQRLIAAYKPACNRKGYYVSNNVAVRCIDTGEIFESAAACARAHNIANSALINHLNEKVGHRSVKGRTYERVRNSE